jgi:hypothetical protein
MEAAAKKPETIQVAQPEPHPAQVARPSVGVTEKKDP